MISLENAINQFINDFPVKVDQRVPLRPQTRREILLISKP